MNSVITSAGIGRVVRSWGPAADRFKTGDLVLEAFDSWPWQDRAFFKGEQVSSLTRIPMEMALLCPVTYTLGCVGQTGVSAYFGIFGEVNPSPQDTVVVSGAAGSVGTVVGQLAKTRGCRVIGICGSDKKGDALVNELGYDAAVNYKSLQFEDELATAVGPEGCSIYFDNVGGAVTDATIHTMREGAHIVLCGQIASYDTDVPYPPPLPEETQAVADLKGITRTRYLVLNYQSRFSEAIQYLFVAASRGTLLGKETIEVGGLSKAPRAFCSMMSGGNLGKQLVAVRAVPPRLDLFNTLRPWIPAGLRGAIAERIKLS